jgi:tRNA-specific 2-thiouridylase
MAERFRDDVVRDFVEEYARGHTPNPCLRCNEKIKFAAVLDRAVALGFDVVCTGHHARLAPAATSGAAEKDRAADEPAGTPRLVRSVDEAKDQSYVLAVLTSDQLRRAMFPLGGSTKDEVRREAAARGLAVADKPDSHDVCFIADGDTRKFLRDRLGEAPGQIVDEAGAVLGGHDGAYGFTVGQRRGLRIGYPAPDGRPRYVLDISPASGTVMVGPAESLDVREIEARRPVWTGCPPPAGPVDCLVQLRAHGTAYPATAWPDGAGLRIALGTPARGIARGQAAVLYDGDTVLGSATITGTDRAARATTAAMDDA